MTIYYIAVSVLATYLFTSIPSGKIIAKKVAGIDIQKVNSGNIGATNVKRSLGMKWAAVVMFLDLSKGFLPVFTVEQIWHNPTITMLVAIAAIVGNLFSVYIKLTGGKGVSTTLGILLAINPIFFLVFVAGLSFFLKASKTSSVATFASLLILTIFILSLNINNWWFIATLDILIIFAHRQNIGRLIKGTETNPAKPI